MDQFGQNAELVLEFPCHFPIKVAGKADPAFHQQVCAIAQQHDATFTPDNLQAKQSSTGKFQSVTLNIQATSKAQIDAIYQDLKKCELVLWAL